MKNALRLYTVNGEVHFQIKDFANIASGYIHSHRIYLFSIVFSEENC